MEPAARMTSLLALTVCVAAPDALAHSTPVAVRLDALDVSKINRVTVALGRIARLERGSSESM